jgi:hypothetical protein
LPIAKSTVQSFNKIVQLGISLKPSKWDNKKIFGDILMLEEDRISEYVALQREVTFEVLNRYLLSLIKSEQGLSGSGRHQYNGLPGWGAQQRVEASQYDL